MYVSAVGGPYKAINNDATILNAMLMEEGEGSLRMFVYADDVLILDRGFRDSKKLLDHFQIRYLMPEFKDKKQKQLTDLEANRSRRVTLMRYY